jgi:thiol-disulfide isomerase/thioredoxin
VLTINRLNNFSYVIVTLLTLSVSIVSAETPASANDYKFTKLSKPVQAPGFNLEDMDGNKQSLKQYEGKVVVINFWATWCPPCVHEMPSMESLYQKFKDKSFVVLGINQWEDEEKVFSFMGQIKKAPTFPILFDPDSKISAAYGVKGLPSSYIVDKQGNIVYRATGGRDFTHPAVEQLIESLL